MIDFVLVDRVGKRFLIGSWRKSTVPSCPLRRALGISAMAPRATYTTSTQTKLLSDRHWLQLSVEVIAESALSYLPAALTFSRVVVDLRQECTALLRLSVSSAFTKLGNPNGRIFVAVALPPLIASIERAA